MVAKSTKLLFAVFPVFCFVIACTPFLLGPSEPNSSLVIGRVVVSNKFPGSLSGLLPLGTLERGLDIEVESRDGKQSFKATTEEQGYFFIPNIPPNTYHILHVTIEGGRSSGAKERYSMTLRRPTFTPAPGRINYVGTLFVDLSDRGITKTQEVRETESARAYFLQRYSASPWTAREFLPGGQASDLTQASAKAEKPEWKLGYQWTYSWKQADRSGTYTRQVVREETFEGRLAYVVRSGNSDDYYAKDTLGNFARKSAGKVVFKRSEPRQDFLWPLEMRKEWTNSYLRENVQNKTSETFNYKMIVASRENVTVPAGTFEAFKVQVFIPRTGKLFAEYWYSPVVKAPIKEKEFLAGGVREAELLHFKAD